MTLLDLLNWVRFCLCQLFNTQKVKKWSKTKSHVLELYNPPPVHPPPQKKIKIFRNFRVFVLIPIPISETSKITEILEKRYNAELWECSFKNSWNTAQMTTSSKWFTDIVQIPFYSICLGRIKLSPFSVFYQTFKAYEVKCTSICDF